MKWEAACCWLDDAEFQLPPCQCLTVGERERETWHQFMECLILPPLQNGHMAITFDTDVAQESALYQSCVVFCVLFSGTSRVAVALVVFFRPYWLRCRWCMLLTQPPEYICLRDNFWWSRRTRVGLISKLCSFLRAVQRYQLRCGSFSIYLFANVEVSVTYDANQWTRVHLFTR